MVFERAGNPLTLREIAPPALASNEVRIAIEACGICRTDLHVVDGELAEPKLPLVPGHQIVGRISELGAAVRSFAIGDRVGVPWLGWTCGECRYCRSGMENLCDNARFTGYTIDGGFAEEAVADARYCYAIPPDYTSEHAAPLLCAGLIGFRAYRMAGDSETIALYGFGSAAHIIAQIAIADGRKVSAVTRPGDVSTQKFAANLGAEWSGSSDDAMPEADAAIIFAPAGELVPHALAHVRKGGSVVCAGIHMTDIPAFPYSLLWGERIVRSVANLTREDGVSLFDRLKTLKVNVSVASYPLEEANRGLSDLRSGKIEGSAVLTNERPG
jgi:propanol-preferring alcohol dehydrogenase